MTPCPVCSRIERALEEAQQAAEEAKEYWRDHPFTTERGQRDAELEHDDAQDWLAHVHRGWTNHLHHHRTARREA